MNWNSFVEWGRSGGYENAIATFRDGKVCDAGCKGVHSISHNRVRSWGIRSDAAKFENNMMRAELVRALLNDNIVDKTAFASDDDKAFMNGASSTVPDEILKALSEKLGREFKIDNFNKGKPLTRSRVCKICDEIQKIKNKETAAIMKSSISGSNGSGGAVNGQMLEGQALELVDLNGASNENVAAKNVAAKNVAAKNVAVKEAEDSELPVSNRVARSCLDKAYACLNCDAKSLSNKIKSIGAEDIKLFKKIDVKSLFSYLDLADKNLTLKLNAPDRDTEVANMREEFLSLVTFVKKGLEAADRRKECETLLNESFDDASDKRNLANEYVEGSTHTFFDLFTTRGRVELEQAYLVANPEEISSIAQMRNVLLNEGWYSRLGESYVMGISDLTAAVLFNDYMRGLY